MPYLTIPQLALRLGAGEMTLRRVVDKLGIAVRIGPGYRLIREDQVELVRAELRRRAAGREAVANA